MTFRERVDKIPSSLVLDLNALLELHGDVSEGRAGAYKLGLNSMAMQDREYVGILDGVAGFRSLRVVHDAEIGNEVVNLRVFTSLLEAAGGSNQALPFVADGSAQVLTAEDTVLTRSSGTTGVLLYDSALGVHWGPAAIGGAGNPDYVFADVHYVVTSGAVPSEVPVPNTVFPTVEALSAFAATRVYFGNVHVWFPQGANGTLSVPTTVRPFFAVLHPMASAPGNDVMTVVDTRVSVAGGDHLAPVPFGSPKLEFRGCEFDARSFLAVTQRGTTDGNFVTFRNCTGYVSVYGPPTNNTGAEIVSVIDSDIVVNVGGPTSTAYRVLDVQRSTAIIAAIPSDVGWLEQDYPQITRVTDSTVSSPSRTVNREPDWWSTGLENSALVNNKGPWFLEARGSDVQMSHLLASKLAWPSTVLALARTLEDPVISTVGSRLLVNDVSDAGDQGSGLPWTYRPPLTPGQSVLVAGTQGSTVVIGSQLTVFTGDPSSSVSQGVYVDRTALAATPGLVYTPLVLETGSSAVVTQVVPNSGVTPEERSTITMPGFASEAELQQFGVSP